MLVHHYRSTYKHNFWLGLTAVLTVVMTVIFLCLAAQNKLTSKDKLLSKKKKLEEEISMTKKLLEQTMNTKNISINQLNLLKSQIQKREALLNEINAEIGDITQEIRDNDEMLVIQANNLYELKEEYARIIYHAWKMRNSFDRLLFIFSAEDFNQGYRRLKYFQQYSDYRITQARKIVEVQNDISQRTQELQIQKENKSILLVSNETEKQRLDKERDEKDKILAKLKRREVQIRKTLKAKQEEARKLQKKIEAIIAEEIKKSSSKTNKTATSNTNIKDVLTPEEKQLSDNFVSNRGRMPWPVISGVISDYYGEHDHPVLEGIKVKNNGIDISTERGASARAVFKGTVSSVVSITNNNTAVILRHGDYFTVYSNLEGVSVKKGDVVATKQNIGKIYYDPEENKTELHFELWEGKSLQNPSNWLASR